MSREFDVIVFGASGYTGRHVVEELANSLKTTNLKWAVAGRNVRKLRESLNAVQEYLDVDISKTTLIEADADDSSSISNMCRQARLILNCVGPYKKYGEVVVSKCIENGTHHIDLSAEVEYLEMTQAKYFKEAEEKSTYIIEACGFGSLPVDYGISLLKKEFKGDLNSIEYFIEIGLGPEGRTTNVGTLLSVIESVKDVLKTKKYDRALRASVFQKEIVQSNFKFQKRFSPLFYSPEANGWCYDYSLFGPDARVVRRSQMFGYEYLNERPVQSHGYLRIYSLPIALSYIFVFGGILLMSLISQGRRLLAKYPSFFTAGEFSSSGPTRNQILEGTSKITFYAKGWSSKLAEPSEQHTTEPNQKMKLTISGPEIGYALTSLCMVHAGLVILQETEKLPLRGGVLTPGVAFQNTSLYKRLEKRGVSFEFQEM